MLLLFFPCCFLYFISIFLSVCLLCVSICSSLGLSCLGLSVLPRLSWLFCFPCSRNFQLLSLQIFSEVISLSPSSSSGTPMMWMFVHLMLSQRSLRLSSFLFILFYVFCSVVLISTILSSRSFICASASVILPWIPSSVLFISVCLFSSSSSSLVKFLPLLN